MMFLPENMLVTDICAEIYCSLFPGMTRKECKELDAAFQIAQSLRKASNDLPSQ